MDPTENPGNRIGRTIWTVWGYLSGAVARFLRPEVTDEGNQGVRTRTDDIDLKSAVNKIDREVTAKNSNNEGKETNQIDSAEVKCSPSKVRVQVASVQWENTDVVKDDNNDELHVHTTKKQTYHCAVWSPGTDTDNEGCMVDALVEKEAVSSDEVQAENIYANNEFKESETAHELEETGKIEQKYGDNEDIEERDQNHKGEKCAKNRKDAYETDVMVQFDQDVEQEKQINMADHGETEGIAGFKHADTHLIDEQIVDQKDRGGIAYVSKNEVEEMMPETRGATEQDKEKKTVQDLEEIGQLERNDGDNEDKEECDQNHEEEKCAVESEDLDNADVKVQSELYGQDVEHEMKISMMDHAEKEGIGGFKHSDEHPIDEKENNLDQKDQEKTENDEEKGLESQVQDLQKSKDPDNADILVQCELYGQDVEQDKLISMMDHAEKEGIGGFKHSDEHLIDEIEEQIVDQKDQGRTENDEDQGTESQVQDLLPQLEYLKKYSDEIACISKNEVEEMMPETRCATEQGKEKETVQDLEEIGQLEQNDGDNEDEEECDQNHEEEKCAVESEDLDNADVKVQSELYGQDVEHEMKISMMDHAEKEGIGGFKHADEHLIEEKENNLDQKDQEKTENDEEKGLESQVQDLQKSKDPDNADILVQCELYGQDVEQDKLISMMDHAEKEGIGGFKHSDEHLIDEIEEQIVDQKDQGRTENDEDQGTESQVQDLLPQLEYLKKYSDEIACISKNEVEEMMPETRCATEQGKEKETVQDLEEIGQLEQNDGDNEDEEECDQNHEEEKCAVESEDLDNADVKVQSELYGQDVEQEMQISGMDLAEEEGIGGFKHSDEHPIDEKKNNLDQKDQEKTENDEEQGLESQVQDLQKSEDPDTADVMVHCEQDVEQEKQINIVDHGETEGIAGFKYADEHLIEEKENSLNQKDQEKTENDEEKGLESQVQDLQKSEDPDNADILVQCELYGQDVEQDKLINMMDHGETGGFGGFKLSDEHLIDEIVEQTVDQKDRGRTENDEDQGTESQVQDLLPQLEYLKKYSDEIACISKNKVEEMMPETRGPTEQCKEKETVQDLKEIGQLEQNNGDNEDKEECDQNHEEEKCAVESEDLDNADVMVQSELYGQDVEQEMQISMMDLVEKEGIGGFKHSDEHPIDEKENNLDQKDQKKTENDEDQGLESQVQDLQKSKDPDTADVMVQCEQDVEQEKQINIADSGETEDIGGFKHSDEHLIDEIEEQIVDQKDRGRTEKDEDQGTESQVQDLLPQLEYLKKYSDEIACISKNKVEEMMPETRGPTEQGKEKETVQDLDEIGQLEQNDGDNEYKEECDHNHEDEECAMESEDLDNADVMVQSELYGQDVEQEMQISGMDHAEKEGIGGFKHSDEHPIDEKENNLDQKDQEKTENDEEQGLESQVQDLQKSEDPNNSDILVQSELYGQDVEQDKLISMMDHAEKEGIGSFKHSDEHLIDEIEEQIVDQKDRERAENDEDQGLESQVQDLQKSEDPDNADIMVQCEQDVEQEKQINIVEHGETEGIGGFKHSDGHSIDEKEKQNVDPMDQEMTENDEEQGIESQVQDLLPQREYFTEEADDLAKPEMLNLMEKYSDEIDEFSKKGVEEVMLETEQDEDTTESEHDTTKYELMESVETLQRVSEELSEKKVPNVELKMTTVVDEFFETVYTLEDSLLSDSKQDTSEKTPETGTGSSMVAMKTEGMVSDLIVCEFPGESSKGPETALAETDLGCFEEIKSNLHDPQTLAEEQAEREAVVVCSVEHSETLKTVETEQDIETLIESLGTTESHAHQEIDKTKFSHKEHVELRTELSEETTDTKISSEDEEAEPSEKEGQSLVIRNVTLQSHELLEFKEGECKSSLGTMDTFSESLGNSSVSEIAENAEIEHVAEEQTDVKPVLTRSLSSAGFLEETVHLQDVSERCTEEQEILETALEYVEGITNQVLKDMIETEVNLVQETEPLAGPSSEEPGDAEYQGPAQCVSADAFVLEEEGKLLGETMESKVEMEVETTSSEVLKQTEQHISSPVCETTEADGCCDIAGATVLSSHEDLMEVSRPGMKRGFDQVNKDLAEVKTERKFDLYLQAFEESSLDFTIQKTRIAVKNPLVRPPKDPRRLLFKASVEPLVSQPSPRSQKFEVSVPSKGVTGFKLPGLGAELPVLRKTEFGKKTREGGAAERTLQPQQKSVAVTEDSVKQEQAPVPVPAKPKWTPPKHPGMGSPFMMAELKSKLKKPVQE